MFWRKPSILILDLYLYDIKTQIHIKRISVEEIRGKNQKKFWNDFFLLDWAGPKKKSGRDRPK